MEIADVWESDIEMAVGCKSWLDNVWLLGSAWWLAEELTVGTVCEDAVAATVTGGLAESAALVELEVLKESPEDGECDERELIDDACRSGQCSKLWINRVRLDSHGKR